MRIPDRYLDGPVILKVKVGVFLRRQFRALLEGLMIDGNIANYAERWKLFESDFHIFEPTVAGETIIASWLEPEEDEG